MPAYDFRCKQGHVTERRFSMADVPSIITCRCNRSARRVFAPPAAIHFRGSGFYATDVTGRVHRRRRPNPGDDLPVEFDTAAARIADAV
jgi:putative FmdB family regulatory protein